MTFRQEVEYTKLYIDTFVNRYAKDWAKPDGVREDVWFLGMALAAQAAIQDNNIKILICIIIFLGWLWSLVLALKYKGD